MIILEDSRNKTGKHTKKNQYFESQGIRVERTKLYVGDYTLPTDQSICIDTKENIQELIGDICGKQHERFRSELVRAQESGIQLYILVENEGGFIGKSNVITPTIKRLEDLHKWINPRLFIMCRGKDGKFIQKYPTATNGQRLMKICMTMESKYGCKFLFCRPTESGQIIVNLLNKKST